MSARANRLSRRRFFLTVGTGAAATAATVVARNGAQAPPPVRRGDKRVTRGYQASEHVSHYYRTARV
jgi:hypothetical protein